MESLALNVQQRLQQRIEADTAELGSSIAQRDAYLRGVSAALASIESVKTRCTMSDSSRADAMRTPHTARGCYGEASSAANFPSGEQSSISPATNISIAAEGIAAGIATPRLRANTSARASSATRTHSASRTQQLRASDTPSSWDGSSWESPSLTPSGINLEPPILFDAVASPHPADERINDICPSPHPTPPHASSSADDIVPTPHAARHGTSHPTPNLHATPRAAPDRSHHSSVPTASKESTLQAANSKAVGEGSSGKHKAAARAAGTPRTRAPNEAWSRGSERGPAIETARVERTARARSTAGCGAGRGAGYDAGHDNGSSTGLNAGAAAMAQSASQRARSLGEKYSEIPLSEPMARPPRLPLPSQLVALLSPVSHPLAPSVWYEPSRWLLLVAYEACRPRLTNCTMAFASTPRIAHY